jgi:hypothetical protein
MERLKIFKGKGFRFFHAKISTEIREWYFFTDRNFGGIGEWQKKGPGEGAFSFYPERY